MSQKSVMPPISWESAQTFLAVVEQGSFSAAATVLGLGQPTVSRRIAQLEEVLSEQLFRRGKYGAEPTAAADRLIPTAQQMAKWAAEFVRIAQGSESEISGVVTIAAPPGVAVEQTAPFAARLRARYPQLRIDVLSAVAHLDLARGDADIALRTRAPTEPGLVAVMQAQTQPVVVAASSYAKTLKTPCAWSDLQWTTWSDGYRQVAPRPMLEQAIANFSPVFTSDDYLVQKAAVRAGLGATIVGLPAPLDGEVEQRLAEEGLVVVPMQVQLPTSEFYIVCAKSSQQIPRVRAVLAALQDAINKKL